MARPNKEKPIEGLIEGRKGDLKFTIGPVGDKGYRARISVVASSHEAVIETLKEFIAKAEAS